MSLLDKILRAVEGKAVKELAKIAQQINKFESEILSLDDQGLRNKTEQFKDRISKGESLESVLPEAFAVVREAAKRTLGQRHYDVQLMGGAALHKGNIAEMRTGEGKTLVSTLPAYLNALTGKGVHIVTVNDYLAERDSEWMGRVHRFLGLRVGVILSSMSPAERREAYAADITYGTNNEFGFDYLRDNMAWSLSDCVQREHNFAIVDEVDSILIDEARTPLIISGPADKATKWYMEFANIVGKLIRDNHYEVDEKKRTVSILDPGVTRVEEALGIENLYEAVNTPMIGYLNNAIRAKELFKRDKDYVVMNGELLIVDEHTGRMLAGRRYSEGLHQALEAKERIEIQDENQTLATITLQNYFRLYKKLGGMTGTAMTEASEFMQIYKLGVIPIPTNKSMVRIDQSDLIYKSESGKFTAVAEDIVARHKKGQPVLVGTVSVEKSEELSAILKKNGIAHEVLNAKQHEREASIIARAGSVGAVTVATNMAGRGTDIMLGGNPEFMADFELQRQGLNPAETPEQYEKAWPAEIAKQKAAVEKSHEIVVSLGGLYVLGTERHESRRIDNQLRGRSGRQGDPGESRFYLSLQDELMRRFNSGLVERFLGAAGMPEETPLESKIVSNAIKSAQTQVESLNFEMRKNVLKYDDVMNKQREVVYSERREVLEGADIKDLVSQFLNETIAAYIDAATATVVGNSNVTIRLRSESFVYPTGSVIPLSLLQSPTSLLTGSGDVSSSHSIATKPVATIAEPAQANSLDAALAESIQQFDQAMQQRDALAAVRAVLSLEQSMQDWSIDTLQSDVLVRARGTLRSMISQLGDAAVGGVRDPREVVAPFVEAMLSVRATVRAEKRFDLSDIIRDVFASLNIEVRDTPTGVEWSLPTE